jgi:hypothetical protein
MDLYAGQRLGAQQRSRNGFDRRPGSFDAILGLDLPQLEQGLSFARRSGNVGG